MLQVEDAELGGPNALLFLQLLISLITISVVNVCAISKGSSLIPLLLLGVCLKKCG